MSQCKRATDADLQRLADTPDTIHFIGQINPPRPGVRLFSSVLEYNHFKPGTKKNAEFTYTLIKWPVEDSMHWCCITLPAQYLDLVKRVAVETGMRIGEPGTTAIIVDSKGQRLFPMQGQNVFMIASAHNSPTYQGVQAATQQLADEETKLKRIYDEHDVWLAAQGIDVEKAKEEFTADAESVLKWWKKP